MLGSTRHCILGKLPDWIHSLKFVKTFLDLGDDDDDEEEDVLARFVVLRYDMLFRRYVFLEGDLGKEGVVNGCSGKEEEEDPCPLLLPPVLVSPWPPLESKMLNSLPDPTNGLRLRLTDSYSSMSSIS